MVIVSDARPSVDHGSKKENPFHRKLISITRAPSPMFKLKSGKAKNRKVSISTITSDDQSIVSALSSSTSASKETFMTSLTFLVDVLKIRKRKGKKSNSARMKPKADNQRPRDNFFDRICLNLYDPMYDNESSKMASVDKNESLKGVSTRGKVVTLNHSNSNPIITEMDGREEKIAESLKQDDSHTGSNTTIFTSYENDIPTLAPVTTDVPPYIGIVDAFKCDKFHVNSTRKSGTYEVPVNDLIPNITPKILMTTASKFGSTSLGMGEVSSSISSGGRDDEAKIPQEAFNSIENIQSESAVPVLAAIVSMTSNETTLFDSLSLQTPATNHSEIVSAPNDSDKGTACDHIDQDDSKKLWRTLASSLSVTPPGTQNDNSAGANLDPVEVNETGNILNDDINVREINTGIPKLQRSDRDIYLSYTIEAKRSEVRDETSSSTPRDSCASNVSERTSKKHSKLKSFSVPRWSRLKIFSRGRDKMKDAGIGMKTRCNIHDSPGAATTATIPIDGPCSGEKEFLNRNYAFLIRRRNRGQNQ